MLKLKQKPSFKKDMKKYKHNNKVLDELEYIISLLIHEKPIPAKYRNHMLTGNYAGIMTHNAFLTQEHLDILSKLIGHKVVPSTQFTGKFRFTKTGEVGSQDIHFDPGDNQCCFAGVCYLSPNVPDNTEGTVFWRHKRTGLESIPITKGL